MKRVFRSIDASDVRWYGLGTEGALRCRCRNGPLERRSNPRLPSCRRPNCLWQHCCVSSNVIFSNSRLKASELSPGTHHFIGKIFKDAGFPPGVCNVIQHRREDAPGVVEQLIAHPATRKINFTGSTPVGSIIAKLAGQHLKPVLLELGGKAPQIVLEDADLEKAAQTAVIGAWAHVTPLWECANWKQGQICMSTERIIVQRSVADKFREALLNAAKNLAGMSGPNAMESTVTKVQSLVDDAIKKGAKLAFGENKLKSGKQHLNQMLVASVTPNMDIYHTETFGPVSTLIEVDTIEEAIQVANDTEYGLSASIFSKDLSKAIQIARRIESGAVHINGNTVHDENSLPHGGLSLLYMANGRMEEIWLWTIRI